MAITETVDSTTAESPAHSAAYLMFCETLRSRGPTLNMLFEQARASPAREGDTVVRDAFSGTIAVVLHDMLREYWAARNGTKGQWKRLGPIIAGYSVPQILAAVADNFRHYDEWDVRKPEDLLQQRSVKIISAVLAIPWKKNAKRPPFRGNVCWAVLEAMATGGGYARLDAVVREFAAQLDTCSS